MLSLIIIKLTTCTPWGVIVTLVVVGNALEQGNINKPKCKPFEEYLAPKKDGSLKCHKCSSCPKGTCTESHCSGEIDTLCRTPEPNEYLGGAVCMPCTDCGNRRVVLRRCTLHSDTECGGCKPEYDWDEMVEECIPVNHKTQTFTTKAYFAQWSTPFASAAGRGTFSDVPNYRSTASESGAMTTPGTIAMVVPIVLVVLVMIVGVLIYIGVRRNDTPKIIERISAKFREIKYSKVHSSG